MYLKVVLFLGGAFFGQNVEIFIGDDVEGEHRGTLCAYGPTSDPQSEYVIHCFSGAMSGRVVTIKDRFTGSLKLCDVQVLGDYSFFLYCSVSFSVLGCILCKLHTCLYCLALSYLICAYIM